MHDLVGAPLGHRPPRRDCRRYFSRAPIPHGRDALPTSVARVHIGLYVYRRDTLLRLASLPPGPLEQAEALEQLRALEHGIRVNVVDTTYESYEVNTPEDLDRVKELLSGGVPAARGGRGGVPWLG
jgi:3-deoxy-manno-octulosonate cytidylyltransferase (CMP-KDO synthetase)